MKKSGLELKVGLFVLISLSLAAGLIMKFSNASFLFTKTYDLLLETSNVGGIRPGAAVLMAGVPVGTARTIELDESGRVVTIYAQIQSRFRIHRDARFTIEQAGFLGDQYISVVPGPNKLPALTDRDKVKVEEPFNLQEVARSAAGLLRRVDETAAKLNEAVARIDQTILAENTLTNFSGGVANFRVASERALSTLSGIDSLVETNTFPLSTTISNLMHFSAQLDQVTAELQTTITTNRVEITSAVQNVQEGTKHLRAILHDLQAGKGLAGSILKDDGLQREFATTLGNLSLVSSNLAQHGILWRPRVRREMTNTIVYPGKWPFSR
jgi:phospholipid/cholesterol/gamma-HCH transport system substrate-binding protein